ncbi:MAG: THUMP domain-containing protein, partial [Bdellovibrionota bacterium]
MNPKREFFAPTAKGMEELLLAELNTLGAEEAKVGRAGVRFKGDLETAYRACLWSRIANRILMPLKIFAAPTPEKLYGGVKSIKWSDHFSPNQTIAVDFTSTNSKITHTHFGALKCKDAIVDQFRSTQGIRPSINVNEPDIRINVYVLNDEASVSIDLSGESLHRRGYREEGVPAPLKENLAAAILYLADWPKLAFSETKDFSFLDPMCGSGTLPIEAAMIAADIAPGLKRNYFGFLKWKGHDPSLWRKLLDEAKSRADQGMGRKDFPKIIGYDGDFRSVRVAITNVERAGLRGKIHIEKR